MNRRDFLLFRTERDTRVVEISCRRLALRDVEWRLTARGDSEATMPDEADGEPSAVFDMPSTEDALADLARELGPEEILRITDTNWLLPDHLRRQIDLIASGHRSRGGRVESIAAQEPT